MKISPIIINIIKLLSWTSCLVLLILFHLFYIGGSWLVACIVIYSALSTVCYQQKDIRWALYIIGRPVPMIPNLIIDLFVLGSLGLLGLYFLGILYLTAIIFNLAIYKRK